MSAYYGYNGFGELILVISPDSGPSRFWYDKAGNLIKKKDANGQIIQYTYDALNRLTKVHYVGSPALDVIYDYDQGENGVGHHTSVRSLSAKTTFGYDSLGNRISVKRTLINGSFPYDGKQYSVRYKYRKLPLIRVRLTEIRFP